MPSDISEGVENFWYSFDYGLAHFVNFNTETDLGNGLLNDEQAPYFAGPFGGALLFRFTIEREMANINVLSRELSK